MIRHIIISNFRSINKQSFSTREITTFVGKNDAGKSNVLRALNLFFNNQTDSREPFSFNSDFNINAKVYKQRAKEISVELVFKLPASYRKDGYPDTVSWKKVWRESGLHRTSESQQYCVIKNGRITKKEDFPPRSKIANLLNNINFMYVPAIKDKYFFKELQGQLYDVIAATTEHGIRGSATNFEAEISTHVTDLIQEIDKTFKGENTIRLPQNLRNIFEALEFNSDNIPLTRRGDGIKIRHIPMMLSFIGQQHQNSGKRLAIKPLIWGFEEPENNVEFATCFELNKQFIDAVRKHTQVFITTHSPAIYSLNQSSELPSHIQTKTYYVKKLKNEQNLGKLETTIENTDQEALHGNIGFLQLLTPIIEQKREEWIRKNNDYKLVADSLSRELEANKKPRIFLEGVSDKFVIYRLLKFYNLEEEFFIDVPDKYNNCASAAVDRAIAYSLVQKHSKEKINGLLLLDGDDAGKKAKKEFTESISDGRIVKVETLDPKEEIINLIKKGYNVSADLESLLSYEIWQYACNEGWLEEVQDETQKLTPNKVNELFNSNISFKDYSKDLTSEERLYVDFRFSNSGKKSVSKLIQSFSDAQILEYRLDKLFYKTICKIKASLT